MVHLHTNKAALERMLREAYEDGWEDGQLPENAMYSGPTSELWVESVTYDRLDAALERVRNGGRLDA